MSFLRHQQIYQSDVFLFTPGLAYGFAPEHVIVLMSLRPAIPRRVALLHCSLPLHRATAMVDEVAGNCQPPLTRGWGIFSRRFGEISIGVDKTQEQLRRDQIAVGRQHELDRLAG
jgi:hypothetical protein